MGKRWEQFKREWKENNAKLREEMRSNNESFRSSMSNASLREERKTRTGVWSRAATWTLIALDVILAAICVFSVFLFPLAFLFIFSAFRTYEKHLRRD